LDNTIPHFSPAFYCSRGSGHVYYVALVGRLDVLSSTPAAPSGRAPCIHARLRHLATKSGEKSGLRKRPLPQIIGSEKSNLGFSPEVFLQVLKFEAAGAIMKTQYVVVMHAD
jgi:hypothetical protein